MLLSEAGKHISNFYCPFEISFIVFEKYYLANILGTLCLYY